MITSVLLHTLIFILSLFSLDNQNCVHENHPINDVYCSVFNFRATIEEYWTVNIHRWTIFGIHKVIFDGTCPNKHHLKMLFFEQFAYYSKKCIFKWWLFWHALTNFVIVCSSAKILQRYRIFTKKKCFVIRIILPRKMNHTHIHIGVTCTVYVWHQYIGGPKTTWHTLLSEQQLMATASMLVDPDGVGAPLSALISGCVGGVRYWRNVLSILARLRPKLSTVVGSGALAICHGANFAAGAAIVGAMIVPAPRCNMIPECENVAGSTTAVAASGRYVRSHRSLVCQR